MLNKVFVSLCCLSLSSCGSSSDDSKIEQGLIGKWGTECVDSRVVKADFIDESNVTTQEIEYSNDNCEGEIFSQSEYQYKYSLGGTFFTIDDKEGIEIDFIVDYGSSDERFDYSVIFLDGNNAFYMGEDSEINDGSHPSLRHDVLNYSSRFIKE